MRDENDDAGRKLGERLGLDARGTADRLAFFQIGPADESALARLGDLCGPRLDEIIADFYAHLLRFPELEALLRDEPGRIAKLQELQKTYFRRMTEGQLDASYVEGRLRVGNAHQRIGLRPAWYIGGFALLLRLHLRALYEAQGAELPAEVDALVKAVFLDMSLAIDTYILGGFVGREHAAALERATAMAEEALRAREETERLKDDLTSMVVHDLKNPVNGIAMTAELALRKAAGLPEAHVGYLRQIRRTCSEMMRLIQNLLEIARMEEGKMPVEREAIAPADILAEVADEYRPVAAQTGQTLSLAVAGDVPPLSADRQLLKRVLANLVTNALRHSGSADVRMTAVAAGEKQVSLRVSDSGSGFDPSELGNVFEKFRSVRRSPTSVPLNDTGLGLPFCKLAVELMGGHIGVDSEPEQETTFWVVLPRHAP